MDRPETRAHPERARAVEQRPIPAPLEFRFAGPAQFKRQRRVIHGSRDLGLDDLEFQQHGKWVSFVQRNRQRCSGFRGREPGTTLLCAQESQFASAPAGQGLGSQTGLAIYYGRPLAGGTGGIYQRALTSSRVSRSSRLSAAARMPATSPRRHFSPSTR